jgi:hypothetical protein
LRSKLNAIFSETNAAPTRGTGPDSVRQNESPSVETRTSFLRRRLPPR